MEAKNSMCFFALMGLIFGIILDVLIRQHYAHLIYYSLPVLFFLFYALAYDGNNLLRLAGTSALTAIILSIPFLGVTIDNSFHPNLHFLSFCCAFPFCAYIAHAFHYAVHRDNTWQVNYSTLFEAVWTTIPLLIVASIFGGLVNALIFLAATIFKTVGYDFLWNLYFYNVDFHFICNSIFFFIGIGIAQQNSQLIYNLRFLLLKMMYYLFPVLAVISVLYVVLYSINLLTGTQSTVEPLFILIPLNALGIIFFNAYFQDGKAEATYPHALEIFLGIYRICLFILMLQMTYKIFQETAVEINPFIGLLAVLFISLTYAITAFFPKEQETIWICRGNIAAALFFLVALILLNLPYLAIEKNISLIAPVSTKAFPLF